MSYDSSHQAAYDKGFKEGFACGYQKGGYRERWFDGRIEYGSEDPGSIVEDTNPRKGTVCPTCGDVGCRRGGWHESCTIEG